MPGTTNVSQNIKELYDVKKHPSKSSVPKQAAGRSRAQIIAIAESQARAAGKKSPHEAHMKHHFSGGK